MSILKVNQFGEIVEDNGQGEQTSAARVQDDNMLKLSIVEDRNIIRDRQALKEIEKQKFNLAKKKWMDNVTLLAKQAQHKAETAEKMHLLQKKLDYLKEVKGNLKMSQALAQGNSNTFYEKMSGVTGYGLTKDGQVPQFSSSNLDYQQIVNADQAFGAYGYFGAADIPQFFKPAPSYLTGAELAQYNALAKAELPVSEGSTQVYLLNYKNELTRADNDPNYMNGMIDMAEYEAARTRGWGTTGFYYNEGGNNLWWPVKVAFHPHMIFYKRVPAYEGKAVIPKSTLGLRGAIMSFGKIYNQAMSLGKISDFAYDKTTVSPAVQAVTAPPPAPVVVAPAPAPTPAPVVIAPVVAPIKEIVKQEQQITQAITNIEKKIEAEQKTVQAVAAITQPVAPKAPVTDYRHPMLRYNLLKKVEPVQKPSTLSKSFTVFGVK